MYNELVQRLREHNGWALNETLDQAADAIENTSKAYEMMAEAYEAEVTKYRWIPVTERLPETSGVYLAWMQWDLTDSDDKPSAYPIEYDAAEEAFGWWKSYFDPESLGWAGEDFIRYEGVTHWMPLPQPPKEE